ncbi:MAG: hypothetical protein KIS92_21525 [Planctomycetota bacterium]|nr:hypothetical protein [Planctomycetota bacterium]
MRILAREEWLAGARGLAQARDEADGVHCLRFGNEALAFYDRAEGSAIRARCPAGVRVVFTSDTAQVRVKAALRPGARKMAWFDLYADGVLTGSLGSPEAGAALEGSLPCGPAGERKPRRLELWLPHARPAGLLELALDDGASFAPAAPEPELLFLGDSITQGMDAQHPSFAYAMTAARTLGQGHFNYGIGGARFDAESLPAAPVAAPAGIVIAYGTNDHSGARGLEFAEAYLARVRALWPRTPATVLAPIWRTPADPETKRNAAGQSLAEYRAGLADLARALPGMRYVPHERLLPPVAELLVDGTHPGDAGHLAYGTNLARLLRED